MVFLGYLTKKYLSDFRVSLSDFRKYQKDILEHKERMLKFNSKGSSMRHLVKIRIRFQIPISLPVVTFCSPLRILPFLTGRLWKVKKMECNPSAGLVQKVQSVIRQKIFLPRLSFREDN
jgi:hypothetical protein